ncbi:hypothetical protein LTR10_018589 [Elasticomyces elasticus]|uniref:DNA2/NAM7 helicase-like C-terminal domain-containing protein n=1 Tax=Exophiala sideris TaxID=1016849 RepID=A0ABR0IZU9_9EURO|nr:hypothetical protein LTR10_018589 [Elasticomyces elasticus]KAK5023229.1 hypothetical protein LTS07_009451 [Exophiala sideris]KAK5028601.1 hypothetical protein LTR13_009052 [Exophiala sideris]KAK5052979.1 hypothetical protein LTR69_009548 [Exophiala sideris]KAK5178719.1 ATP-dependent helicase NAM7 [Eurotiomycetes sp. CCFEE 6388]
MADQHTITTSVTLSYKRVNEGRDRDWTKLPLHPGDNQNRKWNVKIILDGTLHLIQTALGHQVTLTYEPAQYAFQDFQAAPDDPDPENLIGVQQHGPRPQSACLWLDINPQASPAIKREILTNATHQQRTFPFNYDETFPLVMQHKEFCKLQIRIFDTAKIPNWNRARLLSLLAGHTGWNPKRNAIDFIQQEVCAIEAERKVAVESLKGVNDKSCTVWTVPFRDSGILLCVEPPETTRRINWETVLHQGQLIRFENEEVFPSAVAWENPAKGDHGGHWVARVVHGLDRGAAITAFLEHNLIGNEYRIYSRIPTCTATISVVTSDETTKRALAAVSLAADHFEFEEECDLADQLKALPSRSAKGIPLSAMALEGETVVTEPQALEQDGVLHWPDFSKELHIANESQQNAITKMFQHQVTQVIGPPGCAKTQTVVFATEAFLRSWPFKKVLITAPTNGAVDEIGKKLLARRPLTSISLDFVHMISWTTAEQRIADKVTPNPWHIHEQCHKSASLIENERFMREFNRGWQVIHESGRIADQAQRRRYILERNWMAEQILSRARICISTCTGSALKMMVRNFRPDLLIIDEAAACHHYEVLIPIMENYPSLFRVMLAGDDQQFAPYATTPEGQRWWATSIFSKIGKDGFPSTLLDTSYRAHQGLVQPISEQFYHGQLKAKRDLYNEQTERLITTLRAEDAFISSDERITRLTNWTHFLDVADSLCESSDTLSSKNTPEAECCEVLIKTLVRNGIDTNSIMVITGYRDSLRDLKKRGKDGGYGKDHMRRGVDFRTVHTAQGLENDYVIILLTRTMNASGNGNGGRLNYSMMTTRRLLNVALSRPREGLFIIGHWESVLHLPQDNILSTAMKYYEHHYMNWVEHVGRSPFRTTFERNIQVMPRLIPAHTRALREETARTRIGELSKQRDELKEEILFRMAPKYGFPQWQGWKIKLNCRKAFIARWRDGTLKWNPAGTNNPDEMSEAQKKRFAVRRFFWGAIVAAKNLVSVMRTHGYGNHTGFEMERARHLQQFHRVKAIDEEMKDLKREIQIGVLEERREQMELEGLIGHDG